MRPIKFRAWHITLKEMLDVAEITYYSGKPVVNVFRAHHELGTERLSVGDDVVLMQFTGLHDKNGKEIWEGDIVEYKDNIHGRAQCTVHHELKQMMSSGMFNCVIRECGFTIPQDCEVLGNIYENQELLKP